MGQGFGNDWGQALMVLAILAAIGAFVVFIGGGAGLVWLIGRVFLFW